jgi:flagellar biosynthesis protein FliQ
MTQLHLRSTLASLAKTRAVPISRFKVGVVTSAKEVTLTFVPKIVQS